MPVANLVSLPLLQPASSFLGTHPGSLEAERRSLSLSLPPTENLFYVSHATQTSTPLSRPRGIGFHILRDASFRDTADRGIEIRTQCVSSATYLGFHLIGRCLHSA